MADIRGIRIPMDMEGLEKAFQELEAFIAKSRAKADAELARIGAKSGRYTVGLPPFKSVKVDSKTGEETPFKIEGMTYVADLDQRAKEVERANAKAEKSRVAEREKRKKARKAEADEERRAFRDNVLAQEREASSLMRRGMKLQDPAYFRKALEIQGELFHTNVEKKVPERIFARIRENWTRYNDIADNFQKMLVENSVKLSTAQLKKMQFFMDRYEDRLAKVKAKASKEERADLRTKRTQGENLQYYEDRFTAGVNKYRTDQAENLFRYEDRFNTKLSKYRDKQAKKAEKDAREALRAKRTAAENLQYYEDQYNAKLTKYRTDQAEKLFYYEDRFNTKLGKYRISLANRQAKEARDRQKAAREADRAQSQVTMGIASAGIGLLGQAGFPLLNVAFASMSGMKYAGIAAVATAFGEAARAVIALQDSALQSAESLGSMSKSFKNARAEFEAVKGFYGALLSGPQARMYQERTNMLSNQPGAIAPWMYAGNIRTNFHNMAFSPQNAVNPFFSGIGQTISNIRNMPGDLRESYDSMKRRLGSYQARLEGPEEMWRRISQSAASPKEEERRLAEKQLALMEKQIAAADKFSAAIERWIGWIPKNSIASPEGRNNTASQAFTEGMIRMLIPGVFQ